MMSRAFLSLLLLGSLAPWNSAQAPSPTQASGTPVDDISAHRIEPLSYVRRYEDRVALNLPEFDLDADVLFMADKWAVTQPEFQRRALMYLGTSEIEQQITKLVTLQEIEAREAAGTATKADFLASDEDVDRKIGEIKELLRMQAQQAEAQQPDTAEGPQPEKPDPGDEAVAEFEASIEASIGWDKYREMLAAEAAFEKVFLPIPAEATGEAVHDAADGPVPDDDPKPEWMPQITWDALSHDESGKTLRQFVKGSAARGDPIPTFFKGQINTRIRTGVIQQLGVDYFFDANLPEGVFLRLGSRGVQRAQEALAATDAGDEAAMSQARAALAEAEALVTDVTTKELWFLVADQLSDADLPIIMRELLTMQAMERVLKKAGRWMDDEAFEEAYGAHKAEYEGTLFPLSAIIMFRGYDNLDRYREHYRYRGAYRAWREETMTEDELEDHYRAGGRLFFERGMAAVKMAYKGISTVAFQQSSLNAAEADLLEGFEASGGDFDAFAEAFPKPSVRATQGDDYHFQRNPLRMRMTESELSIFLAGYSLADDIFYHGVPGEVFGPVSQACRRHLLGAEINAGVWMAQVDNYTRGKPLGAFEGVNRQQATDDFLELNFVYWSQECLEDLVPKLSPAP